MDSTPPFARHVERVAGLPQPPLVPSEEAVAAARERAIREGLEVVVVYPEVSWPEEEDNTEK